MVLALALGGCANTQNSVVAATGTTIGVELGTQQGTGAPTGVLGYRRAEFAHVPTNRSSGSSGGGNGNVKDVANVVMELHYSGVLSNDGSIYQRLAVGTEAVQAGSAAAMFARKTDGTVDPAAAAVVAAAAATTISNADKVVDCTVKDSKLETTVMGKIVARAKAGGSAEAASYEPILRTSLADSNLRALLKQNGRLAKALADYVVSAECVAS